MSCHKGGGIGDDCDTASRSTAVQSTQKNVELQNETVATPTGSKKEDEEAGKPETHEEDADELLRTTSYMVKNTGLCSFCFGMGISVLFIHVGTTTLAAKEFKSTAAATLPFGKF
jgi:hypothetical protein